MVLTNLLWNKISKNIPFQEEILKRNSMKIFDESWETFGKIFSELQKKSEECYEYTQEISISRKYEEKFKKC